MDRYFKIKEIAASLYGEVWLAYTKKTKEYVIIKTVNLKCAKNKTTYHEGFSVEEDAFMERKINNILPRNNGVVQMVDDFEEDGWMFMVFEYCSKGELHSCLKHKDAFSSLDLMQCFKDIVFGLKHMHECGFAHRDISLENIVVDSNGNAKLCDLGLAVNTSALSRDKSGKSYYMAPEVYAGNAYDPVQADIWSLGAVLYMMVTGQPLVQKPCYTDAGFRKLQRSGPLGLYNSRRTAKKCSKIQKLAFHLLSKLLVVNPVCRISISEIISHPFLKALDSVGRSTTWDAFEKKARVSMKPNKSCRDYDIQTTNHSEKVSIQCMFNVISQRMNNRLNAQNKCIL